MGARGALLKASAPRCCQNNERGTYQAKARDELYGRIQRGYLFYKRLGVARRDCVSIV